MKKYLSLFVALLLIPQLFPVSAHRGGLPIVKINSLWVPSNPIAGFVVNTEVTVTADLAPKNYLVNEPINFAMNEAFMKGPDGTNSMRFRWDFGDKTPIADSAAVSHTFAAPGSYVVTVLFAYPTQDAFYPSDNIRVNIVPTENYQLPQAVILVNGDRVHDGLARAVPFSFGESNIFNAHQSKGLGLTYYWDFGDRTKAKTAKAEHIYIINDNPTYLTLLRVTDKNNISSDAAVFLTEGPTPVRKTATTHSLLDSIFGFFRSLFTKK